MRKLFYALASLWMTIPILVVIAGILIFATFFDGLDVTIGAVRKDWYRSWWFNGLLGLLAVNLISCTLKRKPYQFWMWGYLKTHSGILLIIVGSMVSSMFKIYGDMPISKGGSLDYVQLEDERELTLQWFGADKAYTFPADFNWYRASEPNEVYEIPDSESRVRIKRFFPNVVRQPAKLPERVEVVIHQGNMETPPFVIPVNKATPIPGSPLNITFVNTSEERYLDLKNAGTDGGLEILMGEESLQIDVTQARGEGQPLPGDGTLKVLEVYESLVIDEDGNVVDIVGNPGVKIQITHPTLGGTYFVLEGPPAGAFYAEEKENTGPDGVLEILIGEESVPIDVTDARKEEQPLPGNGTLKVLEVYESLVIDEKGNVIDIVGNPAVKIQITHPTLGGTYFVLEGPPAGAFFAEDEKKGKAAPFKIFYESSLKGKAAPFEIFYQSPLKGSHFAILRTPEGWRYFTTSSKGASAAGETELGGKVRLPFMPVKLEIEVRKYLSSTDVVARPVPPQENQALYPALEIEFESGEDRVSGFLLFDETPERDMSRDFTVGGRKLRATFSPVKYRIMQMVLYLKDARQVNHPGTMNAAVFESDIIVEDLKTGLKHEATVGVNYPFTLRGYSFYQSGFDGSNPDRPRSIFQVLHDPGTNIIYTGAFLTFSGTIFMFYLKPMILRARGRSQRLGGKSLKKMEKILFAFFSLLVPIAVIFLHISRDWDPLRTYERGRIVAVSWIVVLSVLMCYLGFFVL